MVDFQGRRRRGLISFPLTTSTSRSKFFFFLLEVEICSTSRPASSSTALSQLRTFRQPQAIRELHAVVGRHEAAAHALGARGSAHFNSRWRGEKDRSEVFLSFFFFKLKPKKSLFARSRFHTRFFRSRPSPNLLRCSHDQSPLFDAMATAFVPGAYLERSWSLPSQLERQRGGARRAREREKRSLAARRHQIFFNPISTSFFFFTI